VKRPPRHMLTARDAETKRARGKRVLDLSDEDLAEIVMRVTHTFSDAEKRWKALAKTGADDEELLEAIGREVGTGGSCGPGLYPVRNWGGAKPRILVESQGRSRTIQGAELRELVRAIYMIPAREPAGYPKSWAPGEVPAVWSTFGDKRPMCSWCGTTMRKNGSLQIPHEGPVESVCPRCPLRTEVGKAARGDSIARILRGHGDGIDDEDETPRTPRRRDATMTAVTEKKKAEPKGRPYSGTFNFRAGEDLHRRLARAAEEEEALLRVRVSLNDMVKKLLEEALDARKAQRS